MNRSPRWIRILTVLAIALIGVTATVWQAVDARETKGAPSTDGLKADPLPTLYPTATVQPLAAQVQAATKTADAEARPWLAQHPAATTQAFTQFALQAMGPPPAKSVQDREIAQLHQLEKTRTPQGLAASAWLELHGKKDVWTLFRKQYGDFAGQPQEDQLKSAMSTAYDLAKSLSDSAKTHFARLSPYEVDPTLNGQNQQRFSGVTKYCYPSKHSVIGAAEAALLAKFDPQRTGEFQWMESEIDYSRLYAAGHYPSDVVRGAFLGRLIADFVLAGGGAS